MTSEENTVDECGIAYCRERSIAGSIQMEGGGTAKVCEAHAALFAEVRPVTPGNVFEWVWEHSTAQGLARRVLLRFAFVADAGSCVEVLGGPGSAGPFFSDLVGDRAALDGVVRGLVDSGELAVTQSPELGSVRYTFPAYEAARLAVDG